MDMRGGDILVWRSTCFYDYLGENTILLKGYHAGIILTGDKIKEFSICGESPSKTYVTFLVDNIFPIEEVICSIWFKPNGASLYHINRLTGKDIPEEKQYNVCKEYFSRPKAPLLKSRALTIASYFYMANLFSDEERYTLCTSVITHLLDGLGLMMKGTQLNNLLPEHFYNLDFHQREIYERRVLFDKGTRGYQWLLICVLIRMGQYTPQPIQCPLIDKILETYDYPRKIDNDMQKYAKKYLGGFN